MRADGGVWPAAGAALVGGLYLCVWESTVLLLIAVALAAWSVLGWVQIARPDNPWRSYRKRRPEDP